MKTAILILAAGKSSRMNSPKQLLNYKGKSLINSCLESALSLNTARVICVLGSSADIIEKQLSKSPDTILYNNDFDKGMSSSMVLGVKHIAEHLDVDAILIMLCDQPLISKEHYSALLDKASNSESTIVSTSFGNNFGAPSIFKRALFEELAQLSKDQGAKSVIKKHIDNTLFINCEEAGFDIDFPEDYQRLIEDE